MSISHTELETAEKCVINIAIDLEEAGRSLDQAVRVHYIFPDKADFEPCWPTFSKYLGTAKPAATVFVAGLLDDAMKLEIEITARVTKKEYSF